MIKIVLCTVPQDIYGDRSAGHLPAIPNLAIVSLFNWMNKFGYTGDFYDIDMLLPYNDEIYNYFKSKQPDVVGLSAVVSTSYLQVKEISNIIRSAVPSVLIVLGGNMAASANVLLRKTEVDICVLGDGEKPWVALLDYISKRGAKELSEIKGIAFLNNEDEMEFTGYGDPILGIENVFPDYELLSKGLLSQQDLVENYFRNGRECLWFSHDLRTYESNRRPKLSVVWTSKGCVVKCTFCQRFCKGYHIFDLQKLDIYISELKEKYNVQYLQVGGETFGPNKKYTFEVAKTFKKHEMLWFCGGVRVTSFTLEDLKFLTECGCTGMKFGIESGSQKILDIMEKRIKVEDIYTALKNTQQCNIWAPLSFCIGMPGETDETIMETGQFIGKIAQMRNISLHDLWIETSIFWALPLPGSPLYEYGQLQGIIGRSAEEEEAFLTYISDKGTGRDNYINLCGVSIRSILFWESLLYYESMRVYHNNTDKARSNKIKRANTYLPEEYKEKKITLKDIFYYFLSPISTLDKILRRSFISTKIPRSLLYPVMRNLLYAEYVVHNLLTKKEKNQYLKGNSILLSEAESLRKVNSKLKSQVPFLQTLTQRNQQILYLGR